MVAPRALAAPIAALLLLGGVVVSAAPASASVAPIQVSTDGVTWSSSLSSSLFGSFALVPNDATTRTFYVRNNAPAAGYLRLTLRDVSTDNLDFGDALSLRADLQDWPGSVVPVESARPCVRLAEGPVIASGGSAQVDLTALLGDLDGLHGQNGSAAFQIVVSLSSVPSGLGLTGCPTSGSEIAGTSDSGTPTHGYLYQSGSTGWVPISSSPSTTTSTTTPEPTPAPSPTESGPLPVIAVSTNTDRFFQEWTVALWLLGLLLGGLIAARRRRRPIPPPDDGIHENGALP